uniref:Cytochrome c biogenesis protein transmembrane region n=1 Tax=Ceramothamnion japonicum TaxID=218448 RepID=A0A1C9CDD4_CERJP|nr:cytochrome c biogenesis protein transmembrane region [Ceramium japonicum]AOM66385.1 cytochrome c biogenesis protein transmembrane region [Ceramium japonicum]
MQQLIYFYNDFSVVFYLFKHSLYNNLSIYYDQFNLLKVLSLLFLGLFTSLTPCFLSVLPLIFSSTTLLNYLNSTKIILFLGLISSLLFIIGLLYIGNDKLYNLFIHIPIISSIMFIFIALNILGIINISYFLTSFNNINQDIFNNIYLQSYFMGFSIGLGSLPCNGSLILTTILWIYSANKIVESCVYLLIYLLGCMLPFAIIFLLPLKFLKFQIYLFMELFNTFSRILYVNAWLFYIFQQVL